MAMIADELRGDEVASLRSFNRFYTSVIGVLREGLLATPYSLTEARVLYELAQRDATEVVDLRRTVDIDAGYLSRMLARFETDGLITRERSTGDGRRQVIRLTARGRDVFALLDGRSAEEAEKLLARLTVEDRRRLLGAMETVRTILGDAPRPDAFVIRPPRSGDYGWVIGSHGALYAEEYGWDTSFEALVARIVADYVEHRDPERENAWIAEVAGGPVGSVFCVERDEKTAQLRLLLVDPAVRGMGIGSRLVEECLRFARQARYDEIMLWTQDVLEPARRIYARAGFQLVEAEPHHSFGHDMVGENWWRAL